MKRLAAIAILAACGPDHGVVSDSFPIEVDLSTGPMLAEFVEGDPPSQLAVIDVTAPLTVIDTDDALQSRRFADLTLLGADGVARAHLDLTVTELHPCPFDMLCRIGPSGQLFDAIIGADAFDTRALRVDFANQQLQMFPDIAGDSAARGRLCEGVFADPFVGGGDLIIADTLVSIPARRITLGACLNYDASLDADTVTDAGADVQLVVSTSLGVTILSATAYERYRTATGGVAPAIDTLPKDEVYLPSGLIEGGRATIDRLALVGGDNEVRGPCRQVYAHHLLSDRSCKGDDDCPCNDGDFCRVPAVVELTPAALDVLVVADDDPTLQAYRFELRPGSPEVDGILGTAALAPTSIDIDTPNNRVLIRCASADGCRARPELITEDLRTLVADCLGRADAAGPDAGP